MTTALQIPASWIVPTPKGLDVGRHFGVDLSDEWASSTTVYAAKVNATKRRMELVGMQPPRAEGLAVLQWILSAGDRRYWSWSATKPEAGGSIRKSLQYELGIDKDHLNRALRPLIADGVLEIGTKQSGSEYIAFTELGKVLFVELEWRHKIRDAVPQHRPQVEAMGWHAASVCIGERIKAESLDRRRKADIVYALKLYCDAVPERVVAPRMRRL